MFCSHQGETAVEFYHHKRMPRCTYGLTIVEKVRLMSCRSNRQHISLIYFCTCFQLSEILEAYSKWKVVNGNTVQKGKLLALVTQETQKQFWSSSKKSSTIGNFTVYVNLIYQSTSFNVISVNFSYKNFFSSALAQCHSIYQHLDLIVSYDSQPYIVYTYIVGF